MFINKLYIFEKRIIKIYIYMKFYKISISKIKNKQILINHRKFNAIKNKNKFNSCKKNFGRMYTL